MTGKKPKPALDTIIVCDEIIRDETTKKLTLVNIFNNVNGTKFPLSLRKVVVFVSLTGGRGAVEGELRLVKADQVPGTGPLVQTKGPINFPNPLSVVEIAFNLMNVTFHKPGKYSFEFLADGQLVGSKRFNVQLGETKS